MSFRQFTCTFLLFPWVWFIITSNALLVLHSRTAKAYSFQAKDTPVTLNRRVPISSSGRCISSNL